MDTKHAAHVRTEGNLMKYEMHCVSRFDGLDLSCCKTEIPQTDRRDCIHFHPYESAIPGNKFLFPWGW